MGQRMNPKIMTAYREGLHPGTNPYLEPPDEPWLGLGFALHRALKGEAFRWSLRGDEMALLVIQGSGTLRAGGESLPFHRPHWRETGPFGAHGPGGSEIIVEADALCDLAMVWTPNPAAFALTLWGPEDVPTEHRGRGMWEDTAYRWVRTAFDRSTAPPEARLVLGEVVNLPGRWSSYPPHHHPQPEIYYYRFDRPSGYGHGELGDEVFQLRSHDLLKIAPGKDHSQVAAPGYTMYYLWAIRHLEDAPYTGFEYNEDHRWLLAEGGPGKAER